MTNRIWKFITGVKKSWTTSLAHGLAYSQILLARIYEPLVLANTVISWIRLADLNPCTTCTMYISLTIFLFRSDIAFYFHLFSTVQVTVRPKKICVFMVTCQKNQGSVCIKFFFFTIDKTGNSRSLFRNPILVFHFRNFRYAVICWSCFMTRIHSFSTFFPLNFDKKLAVE